MAASLLLAACGGVMTPAATFDPDYEVRWYESQNAAGPELDPKWDGNGWLYVADEVSQGVTVVDLATGEPVQFIRTEGGVPHHPYITKDQRWVLVTIRYGDWVAAIDTDNGNKVRRIDLPKSADGKPAGPLHMGLTPDGRYALVTLNGSGAVAVLDATDPKLLRVVEVGKKPRDVVVTPDSKKAYVSLQADTRVAVLDLETWKVEHITRTDTDYGSGSGSGLGMSADGKYVAVANTLDDEVIIIDTATDRIVHRVGNVPKPVNVEFLGKTHVISTGNRSDGSFSFIDADKGQLIRTVKTGGGANIAYYGPDGNVWVNHNGAQHISVLDFETFEVIKEIPVVQNPHWIYFSPDGKTAYVTNWGANSISIIDVEKMERVKNVTVGLNPNGLALKSNVPPDVIARWQENKDQAKEVVAKAARLVMPEPRSEAEALFFQKCTICHDVGRIIRNNARGDQWDAIVEKMRGNGAPIDDQEAKIIAEYLKTDQHRSLTIKTELQIEQPLDPAKGYEDDAAVQ
ncbi:beta-propeller fold lactonase family protein [Thermaerobacter sp. PB12/4term]|nr:beta-propeller fold lactonase family protein [Thermaerobacter sp. PB12/4term]